MAFLKTFFFGLFKIGSCSKNPTKYPVFCLIMLHLNVNRQNHHFEVYHVTKKIIRWVFLSLHTVFTVFCRSLVLSSPNKDTRSQYRVLPRCELKIQNINSSLDDASCTSNTPSTLFNSCSAAIFDIDST